jgi:hypothetical protein
MLPDFAASPEVDRELHAAGNAHVHLAKYAGDAVRTDALAGRLYFSRTGWLLLSVPNALGRGAFDALDEAGVELPTSESTGQYNAHVTVMRPDEVEACGGPQKITERGHSYRYTLGPVKTVEPKTWADVSKVWYITVDSPELKELRRTYGLTPLPHNNEFDFHITFGVRKKRVLQSGPASKAAAFTTDPRTGRREGEPDASDNYTGPRCPACGSVHVGYPRSRTQDKHCQKCKHRWTDGGNNAAAYPDHYKDAAMIPHGGTVSYDYHCEPCSHSFDEDSGPGGKCPLCGGDRAWTTTNPKRMKTAEGKRGPAAEYCPHCDARLERGDDGRCNRCGKDWPETETAVEKLAALICIDDLPKGPHTVCGGCGSPNFDNFGSGACDDCGSTTARTVPGREKAAEALLGLVTPARGEAIADRDECVGRRVKAASGLLGALGKTFSTAAGRPGVSNLLAMRRPVPLFKGVRLNGPAPATAEGVVGGAQVPPPALRQTLQGAGRVMAGPGGPAGLSGPVAGAPVNYAAVRAGAAPAVRRHELTHAMIDTPGSNPARMPLLWRGARWASQSSSPFMQDVGTALHETAAHAAQARTLPGQVYQGAKFLLSPSKVTSYGSRMNTTAGRAALAAPGAATMLGAGATGYAGAAALKGRQ